MHLAVVDEHADVTGVGTGKRSFDHALLDTLEDGRHEAQIDGATDDAVVELEFSAPFEVGHFGSLDVEDGLLAVNLELGVELSFCRADKKMNLTELACAS